MVLADENDSPREHILASKRLKIVKIKWYQQNKMAEEILMILTTYGVPTEQIQIEEVFNQPEGIFITLKIYFSLGLQGLRLLKQC